MITYSIGFHIRPGRVPVAQSGNGLLITLDKPWLLSASGIRFLGQYVLDVGLLINEYRPGRLVSCRRCRQIDIMSKQWIPSLTALEIVPDKMALCARLHAGLVVARAQVFEMDEKRTFQGVVPKEFWWAEGHEALEANWNAGDFSTWIEHEAHCRAFGVEFELDGLLEMLPLERRAGIARGLSVAGNPDWITAKEARRLAYTQLGYQQAVAGEALIELGRQGFITSRAVIAEGQTEQQPPLGGRWADREWDIPAWFWAGFSDHRTSRQDWELGKFTGTGLAQRQRQKITLSGVYFLRRSLLPVPALEAMTLTGAEDKGTRGRKPSYDWEALVTAVWGAIYRGDFDPGSQAEIEREMQRRLTKGEKEPAESTVRPYASRVWNEFSKA